jgi:hypothetical protein
LRNLAQTDPAQGKRRKSIPKEKKGTKATIGRPHSIKTSTKTAAGYRRTETAKLRFERG